MLEYNICSSADDDIFRRKCAALEKLIPGLNKEPLQVAADNSMLQIYNKCGKSISVHNCHNINAVYIKSEIPLGLFR